MFSIIWLAESDKPTPLAIYIHGGGFRAGSKEKLSNDILSQLLKGWYLRCVD